MDPTLGALCAKLDSFIDEMRDFRKEITGELRDLRVRVLGNGTPEESLLWKVGLLRKDAHAHGSEQRNGNSWNWRRLAYDVTRNIATVLVLALGGWAFGAFVLQIRVSLGAQ